MAWVDQAIEMVIEASRRQEKLQVEIERDMAHWDRMGKESKAPADRQMPWMQFFHPREGSCILELGCHKGANLLKWCLGGHVCHGVDPSASCIEHWDERALTGSAEVGWGQDYDGEEGWDYVVLASVLESTEDPLPLLKAVRRALRPQGEAYVTTLTCWYDGKGPNDTQARFYTVPQLWRAMGRAGLSPTRTLLWGSKPYRHVICWARRLDN